MIDSDQIKFMLYRKCMNYTKIVYLLKNTRFLSEWFDIINTLYRYIVSCITKSLNASDLMQHQLYLSQKSGGLGMQPIQEFHVASKITAISDKILLLDRYIKFPLIPATENPLQYSMHDIQNNKIWEKCKHNILQTHLELVNQFNDIVKPYNEITSITSYKHKDLTKIIDKKHLEIFYQNATESDKARLKAVSINGASQWMNSIPNNTFGTEFSNKQCMIILSLYLGCKINCNNENCIKCNDQCDKFGIHSLQCKHGPQNIEKHNKIRDIINTYCINAGYETTIEEKVNNSNVKRKPGDIKIHGWNDDENIDAYFDVSIVNVMAKSYVHKAAEKRGEAAKIKEKQKRDKYDNQQNIYPLIFETTGGNGMTAKRILSKLAARIATRKNKQYSVIINRMRTKIAAEIMKSNAIMISVSMDL